MRWLAIVVALGACNDAGTVPVEVDLVGLDAKLLEIAPAAAATTQWLEKLVIEARPGATVRLSHPEACPESVTAGKDGARVTLRRRIELEAPRGPIGFDTPFTVTARAACGEEGTFTWRQVSGPPLPQATQDGNAFVGRTHRLEDLRPGPLPWGIVPFSPATRGEVVLQVTFSARGAEVTREVTVAAAARASGVPSVGTNTPIVLGGDGWKVIEGPRGGDGGGALTTAGVLTVFNARAPGRYELSDGAGRKLGLRAGRHDETPLDCGREECHPSATKWARESPMTSVLYRGLGGKLAPSYDPRCAVACHAAGEPGVEDGGFVEVAAHVGLSLPARGMSGAWAELPRELRRVGGVTCTTCHGPGAIPEDSARWSILRADVCAVCHDAPPRYPQVAAWRASRMGQADVAPGTTAEGCRDCHTTAGFLAWQGIRKLDSSPPAEVGPQGIACAACHAPHAAHEAKLVRKLPGKTICEPCHEGGAATLVSGRGDTAAAPHAGVACASCHDAAAHTFRARCTGCHASPPPPDASIAERAASLVARAGGAHHSTGKAPVGAAEKNLRIVVEDRGAWAHNPGYAKRLLDAAERALTAP